MYLLICDVGGRNSARQRVCRYLRRNAQMLQRSVWRFRDFSTLKEAAELVIAANGKVLAFVESDRIPIRSKEIGELLRGARDRRSRK